jgi:tetratricopeptide (TPR) repeat protein
LLFPLGAAVLVLGIAAPHAWAWYHLRAARAALASYHPVEARAALEKCNAVWGSRPSVHLLASRAARQIGDFDVAARELRECQRHSGGATDETAFEWALLQAAMGNVREVEEYLQRRAGQSPDVAPLAWEALAQGYLRIYRSLDAMACLNHWLKQDPDNVRALELRGTTFVTGRGVVKGAEDYEKVLAIDPSRRETRWRLIGCLIELGTFDKAAEHLEVLDRSSPGDPEIVARLARSYHMLGRGDEGRRLLDEALRSHPENSMCLRTLGQLELAAGRRLEAEVALTRAAHLLPDDYQAHWLLFQALQQQGKTAEAKSQLARAERVKERNEQFSELTSRKLAEHPLDPNLHHEMGVILARTGREEIAVQWFLSAVNLDPNHRPAHAALAEYYNRTGAPARAEEHRRKAAVSSPPTR